MIAAASRGLLFLTAVMSAGDLGAADIPLADRRSTYETMSPQTRAIQDDDMANPGMLWVLDGEALWRRKAGAANNACADCHGDAEQSMKGVAARHPVFDTATGKPADIEQRINQCRVDRQKAEPLARESRDLLALSVYVTTQSRGVAIEDPIARDERLRPFVDAGRALYERRLGQLNINCAQCHDDNWGRRLAGNLVPQGHPTGYPLYRLEWQGLGSIQRRLRNCLVGMRADPYPYGADEYLALQLFLTWRARGMTLETPAVRP